MTAIVGVVKDGDVWIGADRQSTAGGSIVEFPRGRVWERKDFIIGVAGDVRTAQILRYGFFPPEIYGKTDVFKYMAIDFVDDIRDALEENGNLYTRRGRCSMFNEMLVGFRGSLYVIRSDFAVGKITECIAIGPGGGVATDALVAASNLGPEERIRAALEAAARHNALDCGPLDIINTKDDEWGKKLKKLKKLKGIEKIPIMRKRQ